MVLRIVLRSEVLKDLIEPGEVKVSQNFVRIGSFYVRARLRRDWASNFRLWWRLLSHNCRVTIDSHYISVYLVLVCSFRTFLSFCHLLTVKVANFVFFY